MIDQIELRPALHVMDRAETQEEKIVVALEELSLHLSYLSSAIPGTSLESMWRTIAYIEVLVAHLGKTIEGAHVDHCKQM